MTFSEWYRGPSGAAWSVKQMAEAIGCSHATVHTLVSANPRIPRPQVVMGIMRLTGGLVQPNDWYPQVGGEPMAPPSSGEARRRRRRPQVEHQQAAA